MILGCINKIDKNVKDGGCEFVLNAKTGKEPGNANVFNLSRLNGHLAATVFLPALLSLSRVVAVASTSFIGRK